jgi:metal-responsive CopG/Arc/MetJ family transcriptional regulator
MEIKLNPEMRVVTFRLDEDLLQKLDLYAINSGVTRSEVIREALEIYLASKVRGYEDTD